MQSEDPCEAYTIDDKWRRSINYVNEPGADPLCDDKMLPGWYRFLSDAGNSTIPLEVPSKIAACGTSDQVWMIGTSRLKDNGEE